MNVGRALHACGSYVKDGKKVEICFNGCCFYSQHNQYFFQVYLVSGGITIYNGNPGIRIDSTEVYSDNAWTVVGPLEKTIWGMGSTSFDNKVLAFGNNIINKNIPLFMGPRVSDYQFCLNYIIFRWK